MKSTSIRQSEAAECGLASIAMVAQAHGAKVDLNGLRARFGLSLKGAGLRDLMRMADELGFGTRALRLDLEHLKELKLPAILHWDLNHFVVLAKVGRDKVTVLDPAFGERREGDSDFRMGLSGPRPEKVACRRETRAGSACESLRTSEVGPKRAARITAF